MTRRDIDDDGVERPEHLDLFVTMLRSRFGDRAIQIAEAQCKAARRDAAKSWFAILNRLRR